jgi:formamidopyrimidine-DNA glycosylase
MPELPEVENFRRLLLPLVSKHHALTLTRHSPGIPPRKFLSDQDVDEIHSTKFVVSDVCRKGKLIWMELTKKGSSDKKYLSVHMGMTGRISSPNNIPKLMETPDTTTYPPSHTHLKFVAGDCEACFSDPRKFGHVLLKDSMDDEIADLAPDAWTELHQLQDGSAHDAVLKEDITAKLTGKTLGIKALLLDQKRAVSGVGNWIADEVLYQTETHPDQKHLTQEQARKLLNTLHSILETAVACLEKGADFPEEWLFNYRWTKGNRTSVKDFMDRSVTFVTSGGRTSAIVPSIQKVIGHITTTKTKAKKNNEKQASAKRKEATKVEVVEIKVTKKVVKTKAAKQEKAKGNSDTTVAEAKKRKVEEAAVKSKGTRKSPRLSR